MLEVGETTMFDCLPPAYFTRSTDEQIKDLWFSRDGITSKPITFTNSTSTSISGSSPLKTVLTSSPQSTSCVNINKIITSAISDITSPSTAYNYRHTASNTVTLNHNHNHNHDHNEVHVTSNIWTLHLLVFCGDQAEGLGREDDRVLGFPTVTDASTLFIFSERWIVDSIAAGRLLDLRGYIMHAPKMFRESDEISFSGPEDGFDHDHNLDRELKKYTHNGGFGCAYGTSKGSASGAGVGVGRGVKLEEDSKPFQQSTAIAQETGRPGHQPKQKHGRHQDRKKHQTRDQHPYRHKTPPYCDASRQPFHTQHGLPHSYDNRPSSHPNFHPQFSTTTAYLQSLPMSPDETPRSRSRSKSARGSLSRSHCRQGWNGAKEDNRRRKEEMCARLNMGIGIRTEDGDRGEDSGYAGCDSGRALDREEGRTVERMHEDLRLPSPKKRKQEMKGRDSRFHPYEDDVLPRPRPLFNHPSSSNLAPDNLKSSDIKRFLTDLIQSETQNVRPQPPAKVEGPFITPAPTPPPRKPSMEFYTDPHDKAPRGGRRIKYMIQVQDEHGLRRIE
ncbi:hypothetical protein HD553DRAFT_349768, partial [Filobasidium floriforme]